MPALIEKVPGFKKHIREFILQTLASTFQSVKRESIEQSLDLVRDEDVGVRDRVSTVRYFIQVAKMTRKIRVISLEMLGLPTNRKNDYLIWFYRAVGWPLSGRS